MSAFASSLVRILRRSRLAHAGAIGLAATVLAWGVWLLGLPVVVMLERMPYDAWLRVRTPLPVNQAITVIARDPASEARFGAGAWDRAVLARVITALDHAGAAVIAVDAPVATPSPPGLGGPASDAMLAEMTKAAGKVIYPLPVRLTRDSPDGPGDFASTNLEGLVHPAWTAAGPDGPSTRHVALTASGPLPLAAAQALNAGHTLALADPDGVVRQVPLFVSVRDRLMPAFGLAAAAAFLQVAPDRISFSPGCSVVLQEARLPDGRTGDLTVPVDQQGQVLVNYARGGSDSDRTLPSRSFLAVWEAIDNGDPETLREWIAGKLVVLLPGVQESAHRTPMAAQVSDHAIQMDLLNMLLIGRWVTEWAPAWRLLLALGLAILGGWLLLAWPGWKGFTALGALVAGYPVLMALALTQRGALWPLFVPLCALTLAGGTAAVWTHIIARHRMRMLEADMLKVQHELAVVRQALVCQESAAEALEEDLEAARAATARSAGRQADLAGAANALRGQLAEAQAREAETRRHLQALEEELRGLRAAGSVAPTLGGIELERLRQDCEQMGILTHDPHVLAAYRDLKTAARSSLPVLLLGEPGTGKELFARAVHRLSPRASQPFIAVNMAAISPELFESELFGHVRGSFTGAVGDRKGYFELAHPGTLFLDEIGDLPLLQQGKLLRVLQEKTFYRVGATQPTTVNVRVVAATNKDLQRGVSEGWFRQDLYFRLTGLVLRLPPLRERPGDVALLAERFVREAAARTDRIGLALSEEALRALQASPWPGNVRELHHCLEQAVLLAEGPLLKRTDLRLPGQDEAPVAGVKATRIAEADLASDPASDARMLDCLRRHEFDMQGTARALGCNRSTVTQRLKGMGFRALVESGGDHAKAALALAGDPALLRTVELKLLDYTSHLFQTLDGYPTAEVAIAACHKRFKNLPDRHFRSLETLVRRHFATRKQD